MKSVVVVSASVFVFFLSCAVASGETSKSDIGELFAVASRDAPDNYCGIYCVYGAARILGMPAELEQIVDKRFVSSKAGSTADELIDALDVYGIDAGFYSSVPLSSLQSLTDPAILRLRPPGLGPSKGHWVLYLGVENGELHFYDPPGTLDLISKGELLAVWDGSAILLSDSTPFNWVSPGSPVFLCLAFIIALLQRCSRSLALPPLISVFGAAALLALVFQVISPTGFIRSHEGVNLATLKSISHPLPEITLSDLDCMDERGCIIVDARLREAYQAGHISNAINVPINSSFLKFRKSARSLDRDQPIVIYCQSSGCSWARIVGESLTKHGCRNVFVFKGGYAEWRAANADPS